MRIMVYSHDTFGLGNIRRMLAICSYLERHIPDVSILILTGSPMLHSFRIQRGIDYVKLPCLKRAASGGLGVRYLDLDTEEIVRLRSQLILATAHSFKPDVLLVDKKPAGLAGELDPALRYIKTHLRTKVMLVLRDILDEPAATMREWHSNSCEETLRWFYDRVLVLGSPEIFDARREYCFGPEVSAQVDYCGYVEREPGLKSRKALRDSMGLQDDQRLALVTTGGGEDGRHLLTTYIMGVKQQPVGQAAQSLIITGPELSPGGRSEVHALAEGRPDIQFLEFTDDMLSYMDAADVVVAMGGYNTVCELLTLRKRAVIVPRTVPVAEQRIRAERMGLRSLFRYMLPEDLTPSGLMDLVLDELALSRKAPDAPAHLKMGALPRIKNIITSAVAQPFGSVPSALLAEHSWRS